jgi:hypothetical protein
MKTKLFSARLKSDAIIERHGERNQPQNGFKLINAKSSGTRLSTVVLRTFVVGV